MNNRFKFRAKLKNIDNWVYGAYLKMLPHQPNPVGRREPLETEYKHLIITEGSADWGMPREIVAYEVIPETVGQCTGLKDKNGKLIYEGDIVKDTSFTGMVTEVVYKKSSLALENEEYIGYFCELGERFAQNRLEVIGNIYENKELLED